MTRLEALRLLDLAAPFTGEKLDQAYHRALVIWHPSSVAEDPALLVKALDQTLLIDEAHALLVKELPPEEVPLPPPPIETEGAYETRLRLTLPPAPNHLASAHLSAPAGLVVLPPLIDEDSLSASPSTATGGPLERRTTLSRLQLPHPTDTHSRGQVQLRETRPEKSAAWLVAGLAVGGSLVVSWAGFTSINSNRSPQTESTTQPPRLPGNLHSGEGSYDRSQGVFNRENSLQRDEISTLLHSYFQAAQRGDPAAQRELGKAYRDGHGVAKNLEESAKWFKKAEGK